MAKLSDWMRTPLKVEEDEFDRVSANQSLHDQVWPSAPLEPDVQQVEFTNPDPEGRGEVRLVTGVLDLLADVAEEVFDLPDEASTMGSGHVSKGPVLDVQERAATSWRGGTFSVSSAGGTQIVVERDDRTRVVITNWSTGIVYLSHVTGALINGSNVVQLAPSTAPVGSSREFRTADAIWAYPAVPGTAQILDVQDEYGAPEWVSGGRRGG